MEIDRMLKQMAKQRHYIFLILVSFFFLMVANSLIELDYLSTYGVLLGMVAAALFLLYACLFLIRKKGKNIYDRALDAAFVLSLLNFICMFVLTGPLSHVILYYNLESLYVLAISAIFLFAIVYALSLAAYSIRDKGIAGRSRKTVLFAGLVFAIVIIIILVYFLSGLFIKYYKIDDEFFISIKDIGFLLKGLNPYQYSVSQQLYYNESYVGTTLTTNNQIIGVMNYPALYLFSYLPVYFIASPTIYNMEHYMAPLQAALLLTALLFVVVFSVDKEHLKYPMYGVLVFLAFLSLNTASITTYLILALLILAYRMLDTKYSWVFLGLCLAIQEMLWVPVVLLLLYSLNNKGIKKGVYDILGSLFVFLLVNSYFIALGPSTFFNAIFEPLGKLLMPVGSSPLFGFFLLANYHILLGSYTLVYGIIILLAALAYVYINDKVFVGLLSMIPFLFLSRPLIAYYTFFIVFLFVAMLIKEDRSRKLGVIEKYLHERKAIFVAIVCLLAALLVVVIYSSHVSYLRGFNIGISNQSLYYDKMTNETVYTGTLNYNGLSNHSLYLIFFGYESNEPQLIGVYNYSIINNSVKCDDGSIGCLLNVNRILLNGSSGGYTIMAYLGKTGQPEAINEGRLLVYNGEYFYISDAVYNSVR
ncbi:MAG: hypothetical protein ACREBH_03440 [Candidatus Micrarchaeaceae archaeon]